MIQQLVEYGDKTFYNDQFYSRYQTNFSLLMEKKFHSYETSNRLPTFGYFSEKSAKTLANQLLRYLSLISATD